jgi:hypothetical protein
MTSVGWEVKPAGWIVLFLVIVLLAYFKWLWWRPSDNSQQKT